jgi:hypothetical protein
MSSFVSASQDLDQFFWIFSTLDISCSYNIVFLQVLEAFRHGDEELLKEYPGNKYSHV